MSEANVQGHSIQGLIKFHGLKDENLRIPYHSSISICVKQVYTVTTTRHRHDSTEDIYLFNGKPAAGRELERIKSVVGRVRELGRMHGYDVDTGLEFDSSNYIGLPPDAMPANSKIAKGLGFSSSSFPTYVYGAAQVLGLKFIVENPRLRSSISRRGSTSAARGDAGAYAKLHMPSWHSSDKDRDCYAEQIASVDQFPDFRMVVFPLASQHGTETAHREAAQASLFPSRLAYLRKVLPEMKNAILEKNFANMCELAEADTMNLHGVTMNGPSRIVHMRPESLPIIERVKQLREEKKIPAWYSLDTGPSVFVNTEERYVNDVINTMSDIKIQPIVCHPGEEVHLVDRDFILSLPRDVVEGIRQKPQ